MIGLTGYSDHAKHPEFALQFTFHRTGNVALGVLSILTELPVVQVNVRDLPALVTNPGQDFKFVLRTPSKRVPQTQTFTRSTLFMPRALIILPVAMEHITGRIITQTLTNTIHPSIRMLLHTSLP